MSSQVTSHKAEPKSYGVVATKADGSTVTAAVWAADPWRAFDQARKLFPFAVHVDVPGYSGPERRQTDREK